MDKRLEIPTNVYEELRKVPLFFVKFHEYIHYDNRGHEYDDSEWRLTDRNLFFRFKDNKFGNRYIGYCLCVIDGDEFKINEDGSYDKTTKIIRFHDASPLNEQDCLTLLRHYIERSKDKEDKYACMEILWFFDKLGIDASVLTTSIRQFDNDNRPYILSILKRICHCLSFNNQKSIKHVFLSCGADYEIYMPELLIQAYRIVKQADFPPDANIFSIVDECIGHDNVNVFEGIEESVQNALLSLCLWLNSECSFKDYAQLHSLYSVVSEEIRFLIIKRYMHDVRLGNTTLDCNLLYQFKNNTYDEFIRYRYCIETPAEPIILTTSFLADSFLTLYNSQGRTFQTFDGVLDFAMTHSDKVRPNINLMLKRIIPTCKHGQVYNDSFKGFVDYQLIRRMNKELMSDEHLVKTIRNILDLYGKHEQYPICAFGDGSKMSYEQYIKCSKTFTQNDKEHTLKLDCLKSAIYDDRWLVSNAYTSILSSFLEIEIANTNSDKEIHVNWEQVSVKKFKAYLLELPSQFERLSEDEFLIQSNFHENYILYLIEKFSDIIRMRILPRNDAMIGFDAFGYLKEEMSKLTKEQQNNRKCPEYNQAYDNYKNRETTEITRRVIQSIKEELNGVEYNGTFFELEYNSQTLKNIIHRYYYKKSYSDNSTDSVQLFLRTPIIKNGVEPYCAPQLSKVNNPAINLPYFWCRGKECFHNNLDKQTLSEMHDWHHYSLYHMVEIMGFPVIHKTEAGNEPDSAVWNFIAVANKAMQKFKKLKCKTCGHLMFSYKNSGYNRYNFFSCINPTCPEVRKPIYLNFCYKCKKELIDSRDTKQCPNGWYICPKCLSCCDDAQYERLAQKFTLAKKPIPFKIREKLGRGHNDKEQYFCPYCGRPIKILENEHREKYIGCLHCNKNFDLEVIFAESIRQKK